MGNGSIKLFYSNDGDTLQQAEIVISVLSLNNRAYYFIGPASQAEFVTWLCTESGYLASPSPLTP